MHLVDLLGIVTSESGRFYTFVNYRILAYVYTCLTCVLARL